MTATTAPELEMLVEVANVAVEPNPAHESERIRTIVKIMQADPTSSTLAVRDTSDDNINLIDDLLLALEKVKYMLEMQQRLNKYVQVIMSCILFCMA